MKPFSLVILSALVPIAGFGQTDLGERSPFLPPNTAINGASSGPGEIYELSGASMTGAGTEICLYDTSTKHSRWLTVGKTDGGIQVVSYDAVNDQAVVRFDGQPHVISLRKVKTGTGSNDMAVYSPPPMAQPGAGTRQDGAAAGAEGAPPIVDPSTIGKSAEVIKQEREARMLVSDLLEISIAQRKAYEEAQAKADAQAKKAKSGG